MITAAPLYNGPLPIADTSLYESPSDKITTLKFGIIVNTDAGSVTVNLTKKTAGGNTSNILTPNLPLDHNESVELDGVIQLNPGDQIRGYASVANTVTFVLDGFQSAT